MIADERRWVRQILGGDSDSFDKFYKAHGDRLYRLCYRFSGSHTEAEDLTQEVFVAAFKGLAKFEHRSTLSTWLYRIALDCWRARLRKRQVEVVDTGISPELAGHEYGSRLIDRLTLDEAVSELPKDLREALILVKSEGLKYREAAAVLGIPQGTVQFRVFEAMQRLKSAFAETVETVEDSVTPNLVIKGRPHVV